MNILEKCHEEKVKINIVCLAIDESDKIFDPVQNERQQKRDKDDKRKNNMSMLTQIGQIFKNVSADAQVFLYSATFDDKILEYILKDCERVLGDKPYILFTGMSNKVVKQTIEHVILKN